MDVGGFVPHLVTVGTGAEWPVRGYKGLGGKAGLGEEVEGAKTGGERRRVAGQQKGWRAKGEGGTEPMQTLTETDVERWRVKDTEDRDSSGKEEYRQKGGRRELGGAPAAPGDTGDRRMW